MRYQYFKEDRKMFRSRFIVICLALLSVLLLPLWVHAQETMSVQVKVGEVRATPSFLGKIIARLAYGDRVSAGESRGAWKKVSLRVGAHQGWMHTSALTTKRIVLQAGQTSVQTGAAQHEIVLAGKGFNEDVETAFQKQNKNLDYAWINKMETFKVSADSMRNFLAKGSVVPPPEGGAP